MSRPGIASLLVAALAGNAPAGMPVEREMTCPIDGETFTVTGTASCSMLGSRMTLRRITSCDWVTRLPVCPASGLPLYRRFGAEETGRLRAVVETEAYRALGNASPWLRAAHVARALPDPDPAMPFWLLVQGLGVDRGPGIADAAYRAEILARAPDAIPAFPPEMQGVLTALTAFVASHDGQAGRAREILDGLEPEPGTFLERYAGAIRTCLDAGGEACDPDREVPRKARLKPPPAPPSLGRDTAE